MRSVQFELIGFFKITPTFEILGATSMGCLSSSFPLKFKDGMLRVMLLCSM